MLAKWLDRLINNHSVGQGKVSCRLHFARRNRRRLLWKRMVSRSF